MEDDGILETLVYERYRDVYLKFTIDDYDLMIRMRNDGKDIYDAKRAANVEARLHKTKGVSK